MTDWTTIAELGTAGGTLALAGATYASVRASNRTARIAERSLMVGLRPLLGPPRPDDPAQEVLWGDGHRVTLAPGEAEAFEGPGGLCFAFPLRNVGAGLAVIHGWHLRPGMERGAEHPAPAEFQRQVRDFYIAPGDIGFWQGRIRGSQELDPRETAPLVDDEARAVLAKAVTGQEPLTVHLLYGDHEGGQPTVTRFAILPLDGQWTFTVSRHWSLDGHDPRDVQLGPEP